MRRLGRDRGLVSWSAQGARFASGCLAGEHCAKQRSAVSMRLSPSGSLVHPGISFLPVPGEYTCTAPGRIERPFFDTLPAYHRIVTLTTGPVDQRLRKVSLRRSLLIRLCLDRAGGTGNGPLQSKRLSSSRSFLPSSLQIWTYSSHVTLRVAS